MPGAVLFLLTVLVYLPALRAGFIWDDDDYVTQNLALRTLDGLRRIWLELGATPQYYPFVHTTFWVEYHLWSLWAPGYHAVNILLHAASALLLWRVLVHLRVPGAWLGAALFVVHPVQAESVAWITERKNVLSGVFYLGALWSVLRFLALRGEESLSDFASRSRFARANEPASCYGAALTLFVAALLSKTVTFTLPAAVLVLLWWKRGRLTLRDPLSLLPFFAAGTVLGLLTLWMEKYHVGARGAEWTLNPVERWLVAGRALWFYAGKLLWPHPLIFVYPRWQLDTGAAWQHLFPAVALAVLASLVALGARIGRGIPAAILLFAGTLFPALGFFDVYPMRYSFVADHFQYHAAVPLLALLAAGLTLAGRRLPANAARAGAVLLLAGLGFLTWKQTFVYRDLETLWRDTLAKNSSAGMAHNNLGNLLTERGEFGEAARHYEAVLTLDPRDDFASYNYGVSLLHQGRLDDAVSRFRTALSLNPHYVDAWFNLGKALDEQGRSTEAVEALQRGLILRPADPRAHTALAIAFVNLNRGDDAAASYRTALTLDPDNPDIIFNFASLLLALNCPAEAAPHLDHLLRLRPGDTDARRMLEQARAMTAGR